MTLVWLASILYDTGAAKALPARTLLARNRAAARVSGLHMWAPWGGCAGGGWRGGGGGVCVGCVKRRGARRAQGFKDQTMRATSSNARRGERGNRLVASP